MSTVITMSVTLMPSFRFLVNIPTIVPRLAAGMLRVPTITAISLANGISATAGKIMMACARGGSAPRTTTKVISGTPICFI